MTEPIQVRLHHRVIRFWLGDAMTKSNFTLNSNPNARAKFADPSANIDVLTRLLVSSSLRVPQGRLRIAQHASAGFAEAVLGQMTKRSS
jgi:hypothetical protein